MISNKHENRFDWFRIDWLYLNTGAGFCYSFHSAKKVAAGKDEFVLSRGTFYSVLIKELVRGNK